MGMQRTKTMWKQRRKVIYAQRQARGYQKLGEKQVLPLSLIGTNLADTTASDFEPLGLWQNKVLSLRSSSVLLCYSSPRLLVTDQMMRQLGKWWWQGPGTWLQLQVITPGCREMPENKHSRETKMLSSFSLFYIFPVVPRKFALLINLYNWLKNICIWTRRIWKYIRILVMGWIMFLRNLYVEGLTFTLRTWPYLR